MKKNNKVVNTINNETNDSVLTKKQLKQQEKTKKAELKAKKQAISAENAKRNKKAFSDLYKFARQYRFLILLSMVFAILGTVLVIIGPDYVGKITNEITNVFIVGTIDMDVIFTLSMTCAILYLSSGILSYSQGFIMNSVTHRVSRKMRSQLYGKLNVLPLKYYDSKSYGDILSYLTNDVNTITETLNESLISVIAGVVMLVGVTIMMFITNYIMAIVAIIASLIGFMTMGIIMGKSQKYFVSQQQELAKLNGHVEEIYAGHNIVKSYNGQKLAGKKFDEINSKIYKSGWKAQFISGIMFPLILFIGNLAYVAICVTGALLFINNKIEFGVITSFMIYIRLFINPLGQLAQAGSSLQATGAASERVFSLLNETELSDESKKKTRLNKVKGNVEFNNVNFGYNKDKVIINDFSISVESGQKVAIVGPTGAGKTTMVNLLMRFYELNNGSIKIDGKDISKVTRENLHDQFAMVLQDTWMFEGTIKENIVYNKENVTDDMIIDVCKKVGIHDVILNMSKGYDTYINDKSKLSVGQRQLITIARAMLKDSPMLILDEATSSVDTRTEILIQKAMDKLMEGRTSFVIAHRLSTIKNADLILVMRNGSIVEKGNHKNLLKQKGFYAELYNSQFTEFNED